MVNLLVSDLSQVFVSRAFCYAPQLNGEVEERWDDRL
jgi:hypothetical protein